MKMSATHRLTECAMLIALATGLSMIKLVEMPAGGSVTAASMLPIVLLAYRHGTKYGLLSALVYGMLQQQLGLKNLSYVTGWQSVVAVILLDYLIAFVVVGLAGIFRRLPLSQAASLTIGAVFVSVLRYLCHVVSGATVWAGLSIPNEAASIYSFGYNATYMVPETIILACAAAYLGGLVDFRGVALAPLRHASAQAPKPTLGIVRASLGFLLCVSVVMTTLLVFPHLQGESGTFDFSGAAHIPQPWTGICIAVGAFCAIGLCVVHRVSAARVEKTR